MSFLSGIKAFFSGFSSMFMLFIQAAIPPAKQILIAEFKDISIEVVKELSLTNLTSDAKRAEAIKRITDAIIANGKEASGSLVRLLIELAVSQLKAASGQ
jgi:hypothetical protein